mmetsp:Transcript_90584/g.177248  ORF Transcript_90584/g.177248 Transcript_90584/m.177248 type:complete len:236 (+) Transcript_90584:206-913(+)
MLSTSAATASLPSKACLKSSTSLRAPLRLFRPSATPSSTVVCGFGAWAASMARSCGRNRAAPEWRVLAEFESALATARKRLQTSMKRCRTTPFLKAGFSTESALEATPGPRAPGAWEGMSTSTHVARASPSAVYCNMSRTLPAAVAFSPGRGRKRKSTSPPSTDPSLPTPLGKTVSTRMTERTAGERKSRMRCNAGMGNDPDAIPTAVADESVRLRDSRRAHKSNARACSRKEGG